MRDREVMCSNSNRQCLSFKSRGTGSLICPNVDACVWNTVFFDLSKHLFQHSLEV